MGESFSTIVRFCVFSNNAPTAVIIDDTSSKMAYSFHKTLNSYHDPIFLFNGPLFRFRSFQTRYKFFTTN